VYEDVGGRLILDNGWYVTQDRLGSVRTRGAQVLSYYPFGEERSTTAQGHFKFGTYFRDTSKPLRRDPKQVQREGSIVATISNFFAIPLVFICGSCFAALCAEKIAARPDACIQALTIPQYPVAARSAGISGTVHVILRWNQEGIVGWQIDSPRQHFKLAVEKAIQGSRFVQGCQNESIEIVFEFLVSLPRRRVFKQEVVFMPPMRFLIRTNLMELNP
jgi:hypothetical protein